jgi:hypothetical protein
MPDVVTTAFVQVEAQAAVVMRFGPRLVGQLQASVMDASCGNKIGLALQKSRKKPIHRRALVSSTMKPLDGGASNHRWVRTPPRGLMAALPSP